MSNYRFITIIKYTQQDDFIRIAENMNLDSLFRRITDDIVEVWINKDYPDKTEFDFYDNCIKFKRIIKKAMVRSGYASEEEVEDMVVYTGCENVYHPEKADIYRKYLEEHFDELYEEEQ